MCRPIFKITWSLFEVRKGLEGLFKGDQTRLSCGAFLLGSLIGLITAVAGVAFGILALTFAGTILCLSNLWAAYQARQLGFLKDLERANQELENKLSEFKQTILRLQNETKEVKKVEKTMVEISSNIEDLNKEGEKFVSNDKQTIEKLQKSLQVAESKLQKFYSLTKEMQEFGNKIGLQVIETHKNNEHLMPRIEKITTCVNELKKQNIGMDNEVSVLDEQTDQMERVVNIYKQHNTLLNHALKLMAQVEREKKELVEQLHKESQTLKEETPKIEMVSTNLENTTHNYEELYQKVSQKLEEIKKYKELEDYKQFAKWRKNKK